MPFTRLAILACLATTTLASSFIPQPALAQTSAAATEIDLPAQPLGQALNALAQKTGTPIAAPAAVVAGKQAPALKGRYTAQEALSRLLVGSGLEARREGAGFVVQIAAAGAQADQQLPDVKVQAGADRGELPKPYAGGQMARGSGLGLLGNTDYMDTPFSTSSATEKFVRDAQVRELADVFSYDASAQRIGGLSTPGIVFRGFTLATTETGINGHYGLGNFNGYTVVQPFERIEVIKGPSAMLQGYVGGSTGASINMVTKRATDQPLARITAFYESENTLGTSLDVGRRFGPNGEWGIRVNGTYSDGRVGDEAQNHQNGVGSLAFDYRGQRLRASFDYIQHDQRGRGPYGCDIYNLNQSPDQSLCFNRTYEHMDIRNQVVVAAAEYDISDRLRVSLSHGRNYADAYFSSTYPSWVNPPVGGMQPLAVDQYPLRGRPQSTQANLLWNFDTGAVKHEMTLGTSYYKNTYALTWRETEIPVSIPVGTTPPDLFLPEFNPPWAGTDRFTSYALVDRLSFLNGRYQLIAGLRRQNVNSEAPGEPTADTSATTPSVALLYKPAQQWMLYGSYIEGLKPGPRAPLDGPTPGTIYANGGQVFAPTQNKQYETGVKWDGGKLGATLGLFQMTELNDISIATADPSVFIFAVDGARRHRGIELNVFGEPVRGTRLLGSLTLMDARLTRTQDGLRDGEEVIGVPRQKFVVSGEYDIPGVQGLTLTGAMTAVGDANRYLSWDPSLGTRLPGYTIFDAGARYQTSIAGHTTTLRLTVRNLFDHKYFAAAYPNDGYLTFGQPRIVYLSAELAM